MGSFFSRQRSPATEIERIALQIEDLKSTINNQEGNKRFCLYYLTLIVFVAYTIFVAHSWLRYEHPERLYMMAGLTFGTVSIVWLARFVINWFYNWRIGSTSAKLEKSYNQKTALLEVVKDSLKYHEAKAILEKYGAETEKEVIVPKTEMNPVKKFEKPDSSTEKPAINAPETPNNRPQQTPLATPMRPQMPPATPVRPYLRQEGAVDKLLDFFMSDGPTARFALICTICHTHNGMALPAEFNFMTYRCFRCGHLNAAKEPRPQMNRNMATPVPAPTQPAAPAGIQGNIGKQPQRPFSKTGESSNASISGNSLRTPETPKRPKSGNSKATTDSDGSYEFE